MTFRRVFLIILDSLGVGALEDAAQYGDENTNTLGNMATAAGGISIPTLESLGIGDITDVQGVKKVQNPAVYYTKAKEASVGKDTMTGHWELMGIKTEQPFKTFTQTGFPQDLVQALEKETGKKFVGNIAASGTQIIEELGPHHMRTGEMILYTSADSVLQIAAHESIIDVQELYHVCKIARKITMRDEWKVGRVIARTFVGEQGSFSRTPNRHDYALKPPAKTVLNSLKENGLDVIGIGKINDIYAGEGITQSFPSKSNDDGVKILETIIQSSFNGLTFINLVDFDMKYGHRRDYTGYVKALEVFDRQLDKLLSMLKSDDLLIITADHGNDPTHVGSDHTREYIPVMMHSKKLVKMRKLETFNSFADIGATIADNFNLAPPLIGESKLKELN